MSRLTVKQRIDKLINDIGGIDNIGIEHIKNLTRAEVKELNKRTPEMTDEEMMESIEMFDDGIYDENGKLIGDKRGNADAYECSPEEIERLSKIFGKR